MIIDARSAPVLDVYLALVGIVTPRPIAWATTIDAQGRTNLAPFSFFNTFGANPPVVVFSPTNRRDGSGKDTLHNVRATGQFVLNAVVEELAERMNVTSRELPPGECEAAEAGLTLVPSRVVKPPRVAESPAHLECSLIQVVPIGEGPIAANLIIGRVELIEIRDDMIDSEGRIDPHRLKTVARLGGDWYCRTGDLFELPRP